MDLGVGSPPNFMVLPQVLWHGLNLPTVHNLYTVVSLSLEIARIDFN
jgi:hypothetical protein